MTDHVREANGSREDGCGCKRCRPEDLIDFVDGALAEEGARQVEHHLRACEACRVYVDSVRRTLAAAGQVPIPEPPEAYWACFEEVVRHRAASRPVRPRRRWLVMGLAPGLAILVVAVGLAVRYLPPAGGNQSSGAAFQPGAALEARGSAGVDSLVVALLGKVPDDAMVSLDEYLAEDADVLGLAYDLPRSARQHLVSRLSSLMKLKG